MKGLFFMDNYDQLNEILVYLFDHALDIERNFLIRDTFKDISVNDMHVIDGDILEGVPDKKIPFNIQCMIKKINKDFIQLIIIIHKK